MEYNATGMQYIALAISKTRYYHHILRNKMPAAHQELKAGFHA